MSWYCSSLGPRRTLIFPVQSVGVLNRHLPVADPEDQVVCRRAWVKRDAGDEPGPMVGAGTAS